MSLRKSQKLINDINESVKISASPKLERPSRSPYKSPVPPLPHLAGLHDLPPDDPH